MPVAVENRWLSNGTRLGRYTIARPIGVGGMGAVYEAQDETRRARVALKTLRSSVASIPEVQSRFAREARVALQVRHPHVVHVFEVGVHDGTAFIAMEYLEGEDLGRYLARVGALDAATTAGLILPVVSALAAAHAAGVVHRDVKPENIFLARGGNGEVRPKVLDFGMSKVLKDPGGGSLTTASAVMGTPQYMAPELLTGAEKAVEACDQYSLAVILYECATGRRPFAEASLLSVLTAIMDGPAPAPRDVRPEVSTELSAVIVRGMAREPEGRFESMRHLGAALLQFATETVRARWAEEFTPGEDGWHDAMAYEPTGLARKEEFRALGAGDPSPETAGAPGATGSPAVDCVAPAAVDAASLAATLPVFTALSRSQYPNAPGARRPVKTALSEAPAPTSALTPTPAPVGADASLPAAPRVDAAEVRRSPEARRATASDAWMRLCLLGLLLLGGLAFVLYIVRRVLPAQTTGAGPSNR